MKRLDEMTVEELAAVQRVEDIERLIAFEAMHEGVARPILQDVPPELAVSPPHPIGYRVGSIDALFATAEEAGALVTLLVGSAARKIEHDWSTEASWPGDCYAADARDCMAQQVIGYTADEHIALKGQLKDRERVKKEIERIRKENSNAMAAWRTIERTVRDAIDAAAQREWRRKQLAARFQEYVEMAGGNADIAATFFERAFKDDSEEDRDAVLGVHSPRAQKAE